MSAVARWGLSLRPAVEADIPFLLELRDTTMTQHFAASGELVTPRAHRERVLYRYENAQVIERDGAPAGLFKVTRDGGAWQLVQIQLSPALQGKGIGQALIRELIAEARAAGASLTLRVLHQNPARHLYERLGFRVFEVGTHDFGMRLEP
jgi:ribosomal protein S18 acetylase RimI-like enzyme